MTLIAAIRSELTKQFTTAMWWILAIVLVAYIAFIAAILAGALGATASGALPGASGAELSADVIAPVVYSTGTSLGYVFPLLIGTLVVTGEFRHKTLTPTFLAVPRRGLALVAKLVAAVVLGALYGVLAAIAAVGAGAALLAVFDVDTALGSPETWAMVGRMLIASVLWALVGIGVGATVRNQVASIVIVLAFTQFVEPIARLVGGFVDGLAEAVRFLPGSAADALVGSSIFTTMQGTGADGLEWWVGALVLLAYAIVLVVVGAFTSWRRDVD